MSSTLTVNIAMQSLIIHNRMLCTKLVLHWLMYSQATICQQLYPYLVDSPCKSVLTNADY